MKAIAANHAAGELDIRRTLLFQEALAEEQEIQKHKWFASERAGHDVGYEQARVEWVLRHRNRFRRERESSRVSFADRMTVCAF